MVLNEPAVQGAHEKIASVPCRLGLKQNKTKQPKNKSKTEQNKTKKPTKQVPTNNQ